jgi:hypothetical protein
VAIKQQYGPVDISGGLENLPGNLQTWRQRVTAKVDFCKCCFRFELQFLFQRSQPEGRHPGADADSPPHVPDHPLDTAVAFHICYFSSRIPAMSSSGSCDT